MPLPTGVYDLMPHITDRFCVMYAYEPEGEVFIAGYVVDHDNYPGIVWVEEVYLFYLNQTERLEIGRYDDVIDNLAQNGCGDREVIGPLPRREVHIQCKALRPCTEEAMHSILDRAVPPAC